ncbi:transmembrane protein 231 [Diabrotica undecimpunctata]|uniref:transmembrane protein 231 n=1 Tax=Diabrotica undecimpunctata TaxID=50387 RepID=UPI003B631A00
MVVLEIFTRTVKTRYKSTLCSKATFLAVVSWLFKIIVPYIISYKSGGFWLKTDFYYEQPKVNLEGDFLITAITNNLSNPIICSTYSYYKSYLSDLDFCSSVKLREIDKNFDTKNDELHFQININLHSYKINSINIVLPVKYELSDLCQLKMQSLIYYQHNFQHEKATKLLIFANLNFIQSSAIPCRRKHSEDFNNPLIKNGDESKNFLIENIIAAYLERNVTTHLLNINTFVGTESSTSFLLDLKVKYPENQIYYQPDLWHILKFAWMQYLAIYIITAWLSRKVNKYIFRHRLVWYFTDNPFKTK